jgi:hypothetical protein
VEQALGIELSFRRKLRRMLVVAAIIGPVALTPELSSAQGLLDFFENIGKKRVLMLLLAATEKSLRFARRNSLQLTI